MKKSNQPVDDSHTASRTRPPRCERGKSEIRHGAAIHLAFRAGFPIGLLGLPRDLRFLFVFSVQLAARCHTNPTGPESRKATLHQPSFGSAMCWVRAF